MSFTAQLGTSTSKPGNIELGIAGGAPPPPAAWYPINLLVGLARRLSGLSLVIPTATNYPAGLFPGGSSSPTDLSWLLPRLSQFKFPRPPLPISPAPQLPQPLPPYVPPPFSGPGTIYVPLLAREVDPDINVRTLRFTRILTEMINSLLVQGYITRKIADPIIWQLHALPPGGLGVLSFDGRTGNVTLTVNDVQTAFGPQNAEQVFSGPTPSFRFPKRVLFYGHGAPGAGTGWAGALYLDVDSGNIYEFQ
jgi:hypothetical protein